MRFDQIMAIHDPRQPDTDQFIEILNCDGSAAQACGNGMRCVVQALSAETGQKSFVFETLEAGPEPRFVLDARWILKEPGKSDVTRREQVTVDLASLDSSEIATAMTGALGILTDRIAAGL